MVRWPSQKTSRARKFLKVAVVSKIMQCNAIQYNTIQYNTIQYNTIQYNTYILLDGWQANMAGYFYESAVFLLILIKSYKYRSISVFHLLKFVVSLSIRIPVENRFVHSGLWLAIGRAVTSCSRLFRTRASSSLSIDEINHSVELRLVL